MSVLASRDLNQCKRGRESECGQGVISDTLKRSKRETETLSWHFSDDILYHMLSFFFSDRLLVDEDAIRSAMLVSKQFNRVVSSSSLWTSLTDCCQTHSNCPKCTLTINSIYVDGADHIRNLNSPPSSFIGFTKIKKEKGGFGEDDCDIFTAKERSSGREYIICVSEKDRRTSIALNHASIASRFNEVCCIKSQRHNFPVCATGSNCGRLIRVYNTDFSSQCSFAPFSCNPTHSLYQLENTLSNDWAGWDVLPRHHWAMIVDWTFNISFCFDMSGGIPFRAMELFRHSLFLIKNQSGQPPVNWHLQLLAAACILISAKCAMFPISERDLCLCADTTFEVDQLKQAEWDILMFHNCSIPFPSLFDFTTSLIGNFKCTTKESLMINCLACLSLQSQVSTKQKLSTTAVSIFVLSRFILQTPRTPLWEEGLFSMSGHSFSEICDEVVVLSCHLDQHQSTSPDLSIVVNFYEQHLGQTILIPTFRSTAPLVAYKARSTA